MFSEQAASNNASQAATSHNPSTSGNSGVTTPVPQTSELDAPVLPYNPVSWSPPPQGPWHRDVAEWQSRPPIANGWDGIFGSLPTPLNPQVQTNYDPLIQNYGCPVCQEVLVTLEDSATCITCYRRVCTRCCEPEAIDECTHCQTARINGGMASARNARHPDEPPRQGHVTGVRGDQLVVRMAALSSQRPGVPGNPNLGLGPFGSAPEHFTPAPYGPNMSRESWRPEKA